MQKFKSDIITNSRLSLPEEQVPLENSCIWLSSLLRRISHWTDHNIPDLAESIVDFPENVEKITADLGKGHQLLHFFLS